MHVVIVVLAKLEEKGSEPWKDEQKIFFPQPWLQINKNYVILIELWSSYINLSFKKERISIISIIKLELCIEDNQVYASRDIYARLKSERWSIVLEYSFIKIQS